MLTTLNRFDGTASLCKPSQAHFGSMEELIIFCSIGKGIYSGSLCQLVFFQYPGV